MRPKLAGGFFAYIKEVFVRGFFSAKGARSIHLKCKGLKTRRGVDRMAFTMGKLIRRARQTSDIKNVSGISNRFDVRAINISHLHSRSPERLPISEVPFSLFSLLISTFSHHQSPVSHFSIPHDVFLFSYCLTNNTVAQE